MKTCRIAIVLYTAVFLGFLTGSAQAAEPNWPPSISIATASPGGTYHAYGAALAKILSRVLGVSVAEQPTDGPSQNIQLIESGWPQVGFVTLGVALEGWNGTGTWTNGRQFRSMRALFPMYDSPFTFAVAKDSSIRSLAEMAGKRMGVGPHGGTAADYIPKFLAVLKLDANLVYGSWDELAAQLQAGKIDILAAVGGVPFPALAGLDAKKLVRFVGLGKSDIVVLRLAIPELTASTIPAGSYPSLMSDYQTVGLFNFAVAHKSLPDSLVYAIVDAVFKNHDELVMAHPAAAATIPANFSRNTFLPFHPGALRYYGSTMTKGVVQGD